MRNLTNAALVGIWSGVLWIGLAAYASAGSGKVQIQATVPLVCEAGIARFEIESLSPLRITAEVRQTCNARHELSVTYDPDDLSNPRQLSMIYGRRRPVARLPGKVKFGTFQHTQSTTELRIFYGGGTLDERQRLSRTIAIFVAPL